MSTLSTRQSTIDMNKRKAGFAYLIFLISILYILRWENLSLCPLYQRTVQRIYWSREDWGGRKSSYSALHRLVAWSCRFVHLQKIFLTNFSPDQWGGLPQGGAAFDKCDQSNCWLSFKTNRTPTADITQYSALIFHSWKMFQKVGETGRSPKAKINVVRMSYYQREGLPPSATFSSVSSPSPTVPTSTPGRWRS